MIIPIRDLKVKVVAFPVDSYDVSELGKLTGEKLMTTANGDKQCTIWDDLEVFQAYLNGDLVNVYNNWIFFVAEE